MQHICLCEAGFMYLARYRQSKGTVFWWHILHSSNLYWSSYYNNTLHILNQKIIQYTKHTANAPQFTMLQWQHQRASLWRKAKVKSKQNLGLSREERNLNTENLLIPSVHWKQTKLRAGGSFESHYCWVQGTCTGRTAWHLTTDAWLYNINKLSLPWLHYLSLF